MRAAAFLLLLGMSGEAAAETRELVRFVSCPVYRDTDAGKKSGCWLAEDPDTGVRYDVSWSPHKPDWNKAVLVEGFVSARQDEACGGVVLDPVRTSILDEPCTRHLLTAEGFPGRRFVLPVRNVNPMSVPRAVPPGPYANRSFYLYFEFGKAFAIYQYDDYLIDKAWAWMEAAKPRRVVVTGYAATDPVVVSGRKLAERAEVAKERAEFVAESIRRMIPGLEVVAKWKTGAQPIADPDADGIPGQSQRRVEIAMEL